MHRRFAPFLLLTLALLLAVPGVAAAAPRAQDAGLPPAPITNDEGGPTRLVGSHNYTDFAVPIIVQDPAPTLLDMVNVIRGEQTLFAPVDNQILGAMTTPVFPPPLGYAFDLPATPRGTLVDVDNDGATDTGVQVFWAMVGANINPSSHLEQLDQAGDLSSYRTDPLTGNIIQGNLLVYAPDDQQGFPSGFGKDGILFTADDPAVGLPQGYTVVHFGPDGFTFDRAAEATLDLIQSPAGESPDFSQQGIVESFNSLIDRLAQRYSFTDLRQLDWEAIRVKYLPQVKAAATLAAADPGAGSAQYLYTLHLLAQSIRDAHVQAVGFDPTFAATIVGATALKEAAIATNLGANTAQLSDGRIVVTDVISGSPAAEAGWTLGAEIVSVDGTPTAERLPTVVYNQNTGTDEGQALFQAANLLKFPAGTAAVTVEARLPDGEEVQSFTLTPGNYALPDRLASPTHGMPAQYSFGPLYGYLTWKNFEEPQVQLAVLRQFLHEVKQNPNLNGIVLDLRGNTGGWDLQYLTMASYFFDADNPVSMHWIDQDSFDATAGELVRKVAPKYLLSAPQPDLYYDGPLVILVDQNCASSCEFFTQFLQKNGRATVIGEHASAGAGAPIDRVRLPYGIMFQYTKGRAYFAGTDEMNLEAKGVVPDQRSPVTVESLAAQMAGADPVLETGVAALGAIAGSIVADSITLDPVGIDATGWFTGVAPAGWAQGGNATKVNYTDAAGKHILEYNRPAAPVELTALVTGLSDPAAELLTTYTANGVEWSIYATIDRIFDFRTAVATIDGQTYAISVGTPLGTAEPLLESLLLPAIDAFAPGS